MLLCTRADNIECLRTFVKKMNEGREGDIDSFFAAVRMCVHDCVCMGSCIAVQQSGQCMDEQDQQLFCTCRRARQMRLIPWTETGPQAIDANRVHTNVGVSHQGTHQG